MPEINRSTEACTIASSMRGARGSPKAEALATRVAETGPSDLGVLNRFANSLMNLLIHSAESRESRRDRDEGIAEDD